MKELERIKAYCESLTNQPLEKGPTNRQIQQSSPENAYITGFNNGVDWSRYHCQLRTDLPKVVEALEYLFEHLANHEVLSKEHFDFMLKRAQSILGGSDE